MAVATANLAQIRNELGVQGQTLLDCAPYQEVITSPQDYDPRAVSFKLLFGYIPEIRTNKQQEVWILLYPPTKQGGHAEVQFHSGGTGTRTFAKHDDSNIGTTVTTFAVAFKTHKKASKSKYVALAKYYYLKRLAAMEMQTELPSELKTPIPVTRTFLDGLRMACREFETAKAKASHVAVCSPLGPLADDHIHDLNDALEELPEPSQTYQPSSMTIPEMPPTPSYNDADANVQRVEMLIRIRDDEVRLQESDSAIERQLAELEEARLEIDDRRRVLEEQRQMNGEKKARIAAHREHVFYGISVMDAFKLGGEVERAEKRRRLS